MGKGRMEAFSDGVIAVIITVMVLELKVPPGGALADLKPMLPVFLTYVLSFVNVGIYWNNHHHMLHAARTVTGPILWANLHLLFWLSVMPFATAWMSQHPLASAPVAVYGGMLIMNAMAYALLAFLLARHEGPDSSLARAFGRDLKGKASIGVYATGLVISPFVPAVSLALYVAVAVIWFIPDRRIERAMPERP
jgi:uncharacterized membrane protein